MVSQSIQTGSWSTSSGDVKFYVSQQSKLDTLSIKLTFSGSCSGSMTTYSYGVSISNRSFSRDIGSSWDGSTGAINGTFSADGKSCSGTYTYDKAPCDPIDVSWTATPTGAPPVQEIDTVHIVDLNFLYALIEEGVDTNGDSVISHEEAESVQELNVSDSEISDLTGVEAFVNLETLSCASNKLSTLDISYNLKLTDLDCEGNELKALDITKNIELTELDCGWNELSTLDLSQNVLLEELWGSVNEFTSLDVTKNTELRVLFYSVNQVPDLDISNNVKIEYLGCSANEIASLDLTMLPALRSVYCWSNQISELDISNNQVLALLDCNDNLFTSLDVSENYTLEELDCSSNFLTELDLSKNSALEGLNCSDNLLTTLDVSQNSALMGLECGENQLTYLDLSNNSNLANDILFYKDLDISFMPTLTQVCVWVMPFPPVDFDLDRDGSPNVSFTTECTIDTEASDLSELKIYPNPTNSFLTIETEYPDHYSIHITSLNGQQILYVEMLGNSQQIDLSSFQNGIYFITIRSKDFVITEKIIKLMR